MKISEVLLRLKSLEKYDASADVFRDVSHEKDKDGFWVSSEDIDKLISDNQMSIFESLQKKRADGYPKVREIKSRNRFKTDRKDPNFDKPYSELEKEY